MTSVGLVLLRTWARKLLALLATVPVLGCAALVLFRPTSIFPRPQPYARYAILAPDNTLGFQLYLIVLCALAPLSVWWLATARRKTIAALFR